MDSEDIQEVYITIIFKYLMYTGGQLLLAELSVCAQSLLGTDPRDAQDRVKWRRAKWRRAIGAIIIKANPAMSGNNASIR